MHPYQLNPEFEIHLPTSYDEITVGQFEMIRSLKPTDKESKLISIVTGISESIIEEWDIEQADEIMDVLSFLSDKIDISQYTIPDEIEINGKIINPKVNVRVASIDQRWSFERRLWPELVKNQGVIDANLSVALAIYLQPLITGEKFNDDSLDPTIEMVKKLPVLKAYPIAYFFTNACVRSLNKRKKCLANRLSQMLKEQQALKESLRSEYLTQSIH